MRRIDTILPSHSPYNLHALITRATDRISIRYFTLCSPSLASLPNKNPIGTQ